MDKLGRCELFGIFWVYVRVIPTKKLHFPLLLGSYHQYMACILYIYVIRIWNQFSLQVWNFGWISSFMGSRFPSKLHQNEGLRILDAWKIQLDPLFRTLWKNESTNRVTMKSCVVKLRVSFKVTYPNWTFLKFPKMLWDRSKSQIMFLKRATVLQSSPKQHSEYSDVCKWA